MALTGRLGTTDSGLASNTLQWGAGSVAAGGGSPSAASSISLTQATDFEASVRSLSAENTLALSQDNSNNVFLADASSALALTVDADVSGPIEADADSTISLTSASTGVVSAFGRFASNSMLLSVSAESSIKNLFANTPDTAGDPPESLLIGFTDDWNTFGYLAQEYIIDASNSLELTDFTPQPSGKLSLFASNQINFLDFADNAVKTRFPTTSIAVTQSATADLVHRVFDVILITQSAVQGIVNLNAENTLAFDQFVRPGEIRLDASNTIALQIDVDSSITNLSASTALAVTQDINVLRPYRVDVESEIAGVTDDIFIPPATIIPGVPFGLDHEATFAVDPIRHPSNFITNLANTAVVLHLKFDAVDLSASTLIGLVSKVNLSITEDAINSLTLTDLSNANLNTTDLFTTIDTLVDAATLSIDRAEIDAENTLSLKHAVGYSLVRDTTECDYTPFVSESDADTTAPRPTLPEVRVPSLPGVRFRLAYPPFDTGATVDYLDLRAPDFGNRERLEVTRIQRETTGGTLIVFADPIWPKVHSLQMQFSALKTEQGRSLLNFIERWAGQEIGVYDYEGRIWKGVIINPDEAVTQDGRENYSATLEIEAERIHQLNRVALSNLGVADESDQNAAVAVSTIGTSDESDYSLFSVAPGDSDIDISDSADYTIIPVAIGSSIILPSQFATRNSFFYKDAESNISLSSIGAEIDFDSFGNLIHNWDAENTSGLSDGQDVISLGDLGSSPVSLNSSLGQRPVVRDGILNGRRIIEFRHSGSVKRLLSVSNAPLWDVTNKLGTIFIVTIVREALSAGNEVIIGNNTDKIMLGGSTSTQRPVALQSAEGTVALETPQSVLGNNTTHLLVLRRNGNNVLFRRNKVTEDGTTFSTNPTPGNEQLSFGGFSGAGNSVDQDMAQVLFYDNVLDLAEIQNIEGLLADKWGV